MNSPLVDKCTPAVLRFWRWLVAGLMWSAAGILLVVISCYWLASMEWPAIAGGFGAGIGVGTLIYRFGFSRIANRNIDRIAEQPERACLFSFQAWKSYILIVVMILLGYALRHSSAPRFLLAVIYSSIGTGLTLSSLLYYARLL